MNTVRARLLAAATIKFLDYLVRPQFESDYNLGEATIFCIFLQSFVQPKFVRLNQYFMNFILNIFKFNYVNVNKVTENVKKY